MFLDTSIDWRVLGFTSGVTISTALLFGLAPALGVSRIAPHEALKEQGRSVTGDRRLGLRNTLVVSQVALSLVLVVAAGLFMRTLSSLMAVPLGFNSHALISIDVNVQGSQTPSARRAELFERFLDAAASVPGVQHPAASVIRPMSGQGWNTRFENADGAQPFDRRQQSWVNAVTPGWFTTYGMRLIAGRDFTAADRATSPLVMVVNEAFVRRFLNGQNPVGHELRGLKLAPPAAETYQIIGVVSDAVYRRLREGIVPTLYVPIAQLGGMGSSATLTVEIASGSSGAIARELIGALGRVDSAAAFTPRPFDEQIRASVAQERLVAILSGFFGVLALLLAALGLYGVTSYSVNRRQTELGVRIALGANPAGVVRLVLRRVGWLLAAGVVAGAALSWWASRFVAASLLYGLDARDPTTFGFAVVVLAGIGAAAGWLPAHRAARIDPIRVLREG